jgi:ParB family chromosome partitioning protein
MVTDKEQDETHLAAEAVVGEEELAAATVRSVPVGKLAPSPFQPRLEFGAADLARLADSVKQAGVLEPLLVRRTAPGRYEIVAGERRWRAAQAAGMKTVPCLVLDVDDTQARLIGLIENLHRRDLSDYERGRALKQIKDALGVRWEQVGKRVGLTRTSVMRLVRFAELPPELEEMMGGKTSARHYEALALLNHRPQQQAELARTIQERKLKGPQAKKAAQIIAEGRARSVGAALRKLTGRPLPPTTGDRVSEILGDLMKTTVRLRGFTAWSFTPSQRVRMIGGMEAMRDEVASLIDDLRKAEE